MLLIRTKKEENKGTEKDEPRNGSGAASKTREINYKITLQLMTHLGTF